MQKDVQLLRVPRYERVVPRLGEARRMPHQSRIHADWLQVSVVVIVDIVIVIVIVVVVFVVVVVVVLFSFSYSSFLGV